MILVAYEVARPYHYTDNDPLNNVDPTGLRPNDAEVGKHSEVKVSLPGSLGETFSGWDRIEVAGFIPQRVSQFGPFGIYLGDDRGFANGPIPIEKSRFYGSLDFNTGEGYFRVNPTHPVDGPVGDAWPISFNPDINWDFHASLWQHNNYIALEASGNTLRLRWSIVHGDRRTLSGACRVSRFPRQVEVWC